VGKKEGTKQHREEKRKEKRRYCAEEKNLERRMLKVFQSHSFVPERYSSRVHLGTEFGF
jgi:hypothetical protein